MDMQEVMKQALRFKDNMGRVQGELAQQRITATVGGGMVSATVNGRQELLALVIDKAVINPEDPVMLQDLVLAAVNDALGRSRQAAQAEMTKLTGGMSIPGLF
ncbi:MAG: YbaB/EbfC family nucleoid-associated protein [Deltaproteobacteria bacterium CG_4_10_14_3_um_filter_60_8]|nr:MAG: YbaB/EbfC family nucleoid-associated protein [Desulfobacterales bacterium CG2_30_60_27]PIP44147.1 MAG: YbaB/EbfC family nucleoid-associated protein [Deltaproteobacteria bacterium CG23_combo_of_CG06-09_8_20_14_all_60_8]PIY20257.1 MAG: YbaB/EbfC family nucleoid-associated protein [Deltaproteobacteria bacterium CG_4_10_14_3_um_filter_60_8]